MGGLLFYIVTFFVIIVIWHIIKKMNGDYRRKNCERCGKPCTIDIESLQRRPNVFSFCHSCQKEYDRLLEIEIKKQPKKVACTHCSRSGKIKGYKCVECNGRGSITIDTFSISSSARMTMEDNSDFFAYRKKKGRERDMGADSS